jgi:hypothetical protein
VDVVASFVAAVNKACADFTAASGKTCFLRRLDATADHDVVATFLRKIQAIYTLVSTPVSGSGSDGAARGGQLITALLAAIDAADPMLETNAKAKFNDVWQQLEPALTATAETLEGQIAKGVDDGLAALSTILKGANVPAPLVTTISLASDLGAAQTSQDVQTALQTAAAPLGSWRDKHKHFSVTVNGYVGGAVGYEQPLKGTSPDLPGGAAAGAFAPVGIDVAGPVGDWCLGVFVSALDVGQLLTSPVSASTGQQNGVQTPKTAVAGGDVNIVQVLSPGGYLHTSLGNSPITVGGGVSAAPLLRYYEDAAGTKSPFSMLRVNGFLAVDLNLIPIYVNH